MKRILAGILSAVLAFASVDVMQLNAREANNGCNIFSIEVEGAAAAVSFETMQVIV